MQTKIVILRDLITDIGNALIPSLMSRQNAYDFNSQGEMHIDFHTNNEVLINNICLTRKLEQ